MKALLSILGIIIIAAIGALWLHAAPQAPKVRPPSAPSANVQPSSSQSTPSIGTPAVSPSIISVNTSTVVTVTVQIADPPPIPGSVNLLLLGATGTQPTILGVMQNTGGLYSLQHVFDASTTGQFQLQVSAAFQGSVQRVLSPTLQLPVFGLYTTPSALSFAVPPIPAPFKIGEDTPDPFPGNLFEVDIYVVDPSQNTAQTVLILFGLPNPSSEGLVPWFEDNIDDASDTLLTSGAFQEQQLANGTALVRTGPIPATYQGGPVAEAYLLTASTATIYGISQGQDANLTAFGYAASSMPQILTYMLGSIH